jgi:hypothetical protein
MRSAAHTHANLLLCFRWFYRASCLSSHMFASVNGTLRAPRKLPMHSFSNGFAMHDAFFAFAHPWGSFRLLSTKSTREKIRHTRLTHHALHCNVLASLDPELHHRNTPEIARPRRHHSQAASGSGPVAFFQRRSHTRCIRQPQLLGRY